MHSWLPTPSSGAKRPRLTVSALGAGAGAEVAAGSAAVVSGAALDRAAVPAASTSVGSGAAPALAAAAGSRAGDRPPKLIEPRAVEGAGEVPDTAGCAPAAAGGAPDEACGAARGTSPKLIEPRAVEGAGEVPAEVAAAAAASPAAGGASGAAPALTMLSEPAAALAAADVRRGKRCGLGASPVGPGATGPSAAGSGASAPRLRSPALPATPGECRLPAASVNQAEKVRLGAGDAASRTPCSSAACAVAAAAAAPGAAPGLVAAAAAARGLRGGFGLAGAGLARQGLRGGLADTGDAAAAALATGPAPRPTPAPGSLASPAAQAAGWVSGGDTAAAAGAGVLSKRGAGGSALLRSRLAPLTPPTRAEHWPTVAGPAPVVAALPGVREALQDAAEACGVAALVRGAEPASGVTASQRRRRECVCAGRQYYGCMRARACCLQRS